MIEIPQTPSVLKAREYFAGEDSIESIITVVSDLFDCKKYLYPRCDCMTVMGSIVSNASELNDFSSFIYEIGGSFTAVATLTEQDGTSHTIVDDTYGTFWNIDVLRSGVWGFKIDWYKVANSLGFGKYTFHMSIDNALLRGDFEEDFCYKLIPFSCDNADKTVRITTFKNGYIENGFDYRNLLIGDWVDQIRVRGSLKFDDYDTTIDNLQLNNGNLHQIQTQISDNFNLTVQGVNSTVSTAFVKDSLLANKMYIDDYNTQNVNKYKQQYVSFLSIDPPIQHEINGTLTHTIKLTEYNKANRKRNF